MRWSWVWALCLAIGCSRPNPAYLRQPEAGAAPADSAPERAPIADLTADPQPDAGEPPGDSADDGPPEDVALPDASDDADATGTVIPDARPMDLTPDAFPPAGCGTGTANLTNVRNADGVVVHTDGTIFFLTDDATHSWVGRIRVGRAPEIQWGRVTNLPTTWGLALDSERVRIYVLVVDAPGGLIAFDNLLLDGPPTSSEFLRGINSGNDVVVGNDGTVYYTQRTDRRIYKVPATGGVPSAVTQNQVGSAAMNTAPAGLTISPAGKLVVGLERGGPILEISFDAGGETGRTEVMGFAGGWANGLTYDRGGHLYVALYHDTVPQSVLRLDPGGGTTTVTSGGRFSSLAFGRGALDCRDLYIADPYGPLRVVRVPNSL